MSQFTMFGFDGLGDFGRIKGGSKQGKERHCGCSIKTAKVKTRGKKKRVVRTQPYVSCPGTPMKRFVTEAQATGLRRRAFCAWLVKPVTGKRRRGGGRRRRG